MNIEAPTLSVCPVLEVVTNLTLVVGQPFMLTNVVTVWFQDTGNPNLMDAMTFTVVVRECVRPRLGRLILPPGETGSVPFNVFTTVPVVDLATYVDIPLDRLVNPGVEARLPEICTNTIEHFTNDLHLLTVATCTNQSLMGNQEVAWLYVTADMNPASAFRWLVIGDSVARQTDGSVVTNYTGQATRVVIVGEEPLLEAVMDQNRQPQLIL